MRAKVDPKAKSPHPSASESENRLPSSGPLEPRQHRTYSLWRTYTWNSGTGWPLIVRLPEKILDAPAPSDGSANDKYN